GVSFNCWQRGGGGGPIATGAGTRLSWRVVEEEIPSNCWKESASTAGCWQREERRRSNRYWSWDWTDDCTGTLIPDSLM
ncbi:hypothetical protein SK128_006520, partial [Halocaridina rubra]